MGGKTMAEVVRLNIAQARAFFDALALSPEESAIADKVLVEIEGGIVPPDLIAALAAHPPAAERFAAFPWSARREILVWIGSAKRAATRAARITETAIRAARNERATQRPGD